MPGINLTRVEASERAAIITTREYAVDLDLTQGEETFRSVTVAQSATTSSSLCSARFSRAMRLSW